MLLTPSQTEQLFKAANIPKRLIIKRKELKLSKQQFASRLAISVPILNQYEKAQAIPNDSYLEHFFEF